MTPTSAKGHDAVRRTQQSLFRYKKKSTPAPIAQRETLALYSCAVSAYHASLLRHSHVEVTNALHGIDLTAEDGQGLCGACYRIDQRRVKKRPDGEVGGKPASAVARDSRASCPSSTGPHRVLYTCHSGRQVQIPPRRSRVPAKLLRR